MFRENKNDKTKENNMRKNWAEKFDEEQDELAERIARNREITRLAEEKTKQQATQKQEDAELPVDVSSIQVGWMRPFQNIPTCDGNYSFFDDEDERE